ncbi:HTH domain protein [Selenomonas sp. oral taxon 892 str. F0426]|uniref:HTH domain-containing protein n=1 Tax=Selenomonas sp. oral taxon 892 TaxID=1321785 RepID=UPI0003AD6292|nr:HTH domain-containing protein [Selenomonas sp. oral taxon 892]ERJ95690.1 HTH domain protein [Selenomonas sp. oral taxon 892 str. F0426]
MIQIDRRAAILDVLHQRKYDTMRNLAHEFGVSRQTIQKDITALSLDHPEIDVRSGRHQGGVFIKDGFRSDRRYLNPGEVELLERLRDRESGKDRQTLDGILRRLAI